MKNTPALLIKSIKIGKRYHLSEQVHDEPNNLHQVGFSVKKVNIAGDKAAGVPRITQYTQYAQYTQYTQYKHNYTILHRQRSTSDVG